MQRKHTKYGPKFAKTDFFSGLRNLQLRTKQKSARLRQMLKPSMQNMERNPGSKL